MSFKSQVVLFIITAFHYYKGSNIVSDRINKKKKNNLKMNN